ncbi:MAG: hypothetical protein IJ170_08965 [Ruminococcus sp.]|nr:hypothetical protein [Ruminococcus sp.]
MKKLLSLITAAMLAFPAAVPVKTAAEEESQLRKLVDVLGGDTDYLNLQNFGIQLPSVGGTTRYRNLVTFLPQERTEPWEEDRGWYSDISLGASILTIKSHNNEFYAFGQKVSCLKDAEIDDFALETIKIQQDSMMLNNFRLAIGRRFHKMTAKEKIADLLVTAQEMGDLGKYFLIMYGSYFTEPASPDEDPSGINRPMYTHCAVGMGVCEGSWTFGDRSFDRCILTLDNENIAEKGQAFDERTCIYVNSQTLDYYVPLYSDIAQGELHMIGLDMDNYTEEIKNVTNLCLCNNDFYKDYSVALTDEEGNVRLLNKENEYEDYFHTPLNNELYLDTTEFTVMRRGQDPERIYSNIVFDNYYHTGEFLISGGDSDLYFSKNKFVVDLQPVLETSIVPYDFVHYQLLINDRAGVSSRCNWFFSGYTYDKATFELDGRSVLFDPGNDPGETSLRLTCDDGSNSHRYSIKLCTVMPVKICLDDEFGADFYIDPDGDGEFDKLIGQGDVNCDGAVDAADASLVLTDYADTLTGGYTKLDLKKADMNGDKNIDASDASDILVLYSEHMTS